MQSEPWQLFPVGVLYLGLRFIDTAATARGWVAHAVARHALVWTLSIGVYATSWSFFGSVGLAEKQGFNFLVTYPGTTIAFVTSLMLLRQFLKITETCRLVSLDEYFISVVNNYQPQYNETGIAGMLGISRKNPWGKRQRLAIPSRKP